MADAAPADRRRALPAGRPDLAAARAVPAGDHHGAAGDQLPAIPIPTPVAADAADQLWKNLGPVRGVRGDRAGDGLRGHGTGSRHGRVRAVEDASRAARSSAPRSRASGWCWRSASSWPSRWAGSTRRSCSSRCRSSAGSRLAVLAWLGLAAWAAITFLASTVTGSTAAAAGIGFVALLVLSIASADAGRRAGSCPAGWPARRSRSAAGAPVDRRRVVTPVIATVVLIAAAVGRRRLVVPAAGALSVGASAIVRRPRARATRRSRSAP